MLKFLYPALWISQFGVNQGWSSFNENPRLVGDVDGDGKSDVIGFANDGTYVSLSSGKDLGDGKKWVGNYARFAGGWASYNQYPRFVADVNGDKKADVVGFGHDFTWVSLSTGSGFAEPAIWVKNYAYSIASGGWSSFDLYPRSLGDVNGDGKADVIGFGASYTWISYSTGNSFSEPQNLLTEFSVDSGWRSFNDTPRWVGDVNGDGKVDIVGFNGTGVWVSLSVGTGFLAPTLWSGWFGNSADAGHWTSFDQFPRFVKDVNGDGKADIIGFGLAGIYVSLSNGKGFDLPLLVMFHYGKLAAAGGWNSFERHPRTIGDANGDGNSDIFGFGIAGVHVALSLDVTNAINPINLKGIKANSTACDAKCTSECKEYGPRSNCLDKCKANCDCEVQNDTKQSEVGSFGVWIWIASFAILGIVVLNYFKGMRKSKKVLYADFGVESETPYIRA